MHAASKMRAYYEDAAVGVHNSTQMQMLRTKCIQEALGDGGLDFVGMSHKIFENAKKAAREAGNLASFTAPLVYPEHEQGEEEYGYDEDDDYQEPRIEDRG